MLDDKTKALIIKYLRKAWLYSPARRAAVKAAESGKLTKEGEKIYICNGNDGTEQHKVVKVYVDHLEPFIPVTGFDSWDGIIERLFNEKNEHVLCKMHHALKTRQENLERKRVKKNDNKRA